MTKEIKYKGFTIKIHVALGFKIEKGIDGSTFHKAIVSISEDDEITHHLFNSKDNLEDQLVNLEQAAKIKIDKIINLDNNYPNETKILQDLGFE